MNVVQIAFRHLHPDVQRVVFNLGWSTLRPIQVLMFRAFYEGVNDLLCMAPTGEGKSESIYLPALSEMVRFPQPSVQVLAIMPLKSLINDQHQRLEQLAKPLNVSVCPWHGDVSQSVKNQLRKRPEGIVLITPESLEAMLMRRSAEVPRLFCHLRLVIIDEVHAMLESERGMHLRSLLSRIFALVGQRPRVVGLSATVGDKAVAKAFINSDRPDTVEVIEDTDSCRELRVAVLSWVEDPKAEPTGSRGVLGQITEEIATLTQATSNLIFVNSRRDDETVSDYLHRIVAERQWPEDPYCSHHGSLSKEVREATEVRLKSGRPTNAIGTSSIEMGIDIPETHTVFIVRCPWSVSSLVQRYGRSGRKAGQPSRLRLYTIDRLPLKHGTLSDRLFPNLLRGLALVQLALTKKVEPADGDRFHASTFVHQTLSLVRQRGAVAAEELFQGLCVTGPFRKITPSLLIAILRSLKARALIEQDSAGRLVLGKQGEKVTEASDFYAAFSSPVEFTVLHNETPIAELPATQLPMAGQCITLAGRSWRVLDIQPRNRVIRVAAASASEAPSFLGEPGDIHTMVFKQMQAILRSVDVPAYLDPEGVQRLQLARGLAAEAGLGEREILISQGSVTWFPWMGTRTVRTLTLYAAWAKLKSQHEGLALRYPGDEVGRFKAHLQVIAQGRVEPAVLASLMRQKAFEKFDVYLDDPILDEVNASDRLDVEGARAAATAALNELEAYRM